MVADYPSTRLLSPRREGLQQQSQIHIGLDVARSLKGDQTVFAIAQGDAITHLEPSRQPDLMATVGRASQLIEEFHPRTIRIDDMGVGGGVTDRLQELTEQSQSRALCAVEVAKIVFGGNPLFTDRYADIRTEMWWNMGEMLREKRIRIPNNPVLFEQLTAPTMLSDSRGRLRLESKDLMRSRGIKSPDLADAVAMAVYPDGWMDNGRFSVW